MGTVNRSQLFEFFWRGEGGRVLRDELFLLINRLLFYLFILLYTIKDKSQHRDLQELHRRTPELPKQLLLKLKSIYLMASEASPLGGVDRETSSC